MTTRRVWIVLPDLLSIRVFFDTGIVDGLRQRLEGAVAGVFLIPADDTRAWEHRLGEAPAVQGAELAVSSGRLGERAARRVDTALDRQLGYYPLAIRLNRRHGFHADRMQPGHPNWMLDSSRGGRLPRSDRVERAMQRWFFSPRRHVPSRLLETMRADCAALVVANVQPQSVMPYLAAARRLGLPVVAYVASWDHTVGKGVISPHCDRYVVQNEVMAEDLRRYHEIDGSRILVTGWPQTDVFQRARPRREYEALLRSYELDPARPLVLVMGNTPTNAPYEGRLVERLLSWWADGPRERFQLLFRPHPRDRDWTTRFASARGRAGVHLQEPSFTDLEELAVLLQHADAVVANAGTILLDALVNDRPAVCVLYDEGAPAGESWAAKNVVGKHYEELAASGAFYRAESFDEVVAGLERALANPGELADARRSVVRDVVGEVDGRAAERAVDAIVEIVRPTV
ncbi:MAG TPA: CDP-glycerol glycerophosphotransferase family protein [Gaiellaceae bacterium]|nr:CDP-glycerol glycerophosphotransferase family protein [Gaiellaceae bacterium]